MRILQIYLIVFVTQSCLGDPLINYKLIETEVNELMENCGKIEAATRGPDFSKVNFAPLGRNEKNVRGVVISQRHMLLSAQSLLDTCSSLLELKELVEAAHNYKILTRICPEDVTCDDYTTPNRLQFVGACNNQKPNGTVLIEFDIKISISPVCMLDDSSIPVKQIMVAVNKNYPEPGTKEENQILKNCSGFLCLHEPGMDGNLIFAQFKERWFFVGFRPNGLDYQTIFDFSNLDIKKYKYLIPTNNGSLGAPPGPGSTRMTTENFLKKSPYDYYEYEDSLDTVDTTVTNSGRRGGLIIVFNILIAYLVTF